MSIFEKGIIESQENKKFRHELIQNEFRDALTDKEYEAPVNTGGVVVLSAKEYTAIYGEPIDYTLDANLENKLRIEMGIEMIRKIGAHKNHKTEDEIQDRDIILDAPALVLSGTTSQLPFMKQTVEDLHFPLEKVEMVDCGDVGVGNTKTQFETIGTFYADKKPEHVIFISTSYHTPRVARTGNNSLNNLSFDVVPVPYSKYKFNVFKVVRGEVGRIEKYSEKGDISRNLK